MHLRRTLRRVSVTLFAATAFSAGHACTTAGGSESSTCRFAYDNNVQNRIVIPALRHKFGDGYRYFNYEHPYIERDENRVSIGISALKEINGARLLYENSFIVVIDACELKVLRAYSTEEFHKG